MKGEPEYKRIILVNGCKDCPLLRGVAKSLRLQCTALLSEEGTAWVEEHHMQYGASRVDCPLKMVEVTPHYTFVEKPDDEE